MCVEGRLVFKGGIEIYILLCSVLKESKSLMKVE